MLRNYHDRWRKFARRQVVLQKNLTPKPSVTFYVHSDTRRRAVAWTRALANRVKSTPRINQRFSSFLQATQGFQINK